MIDDWFVIQLTFYNYINGIFNQRLRVLKRIPIEPIQDMCKERWTAIQQRKENVQLKPCYGKDKHIQTDAFVSREQKQQFC